MKVYVSFWWWWNECTKVSQTLFPHWWQFLLVDVPFIWYFRVEANRVVCYAHPDAPLIEDYRAGDMICSECGLVVGDRYQWTTDFVIFAKLQFTKLSFPGPLQLATSNEVFARMMCLISINRGQLIVDNCARMLMFQVG